MPNEQRNSLNGQYQLKLQATPPERHETAWQKAKNNQTINPAYYAEAEQAIERTVNGALADNKWKNKAQRINHKARLRRIALSTDIFNAEAVKTYIATCKILSGERKGTDASDPTKMALQCTYANFAQYNNIEFKIVTLKKKSPIPLIPSNENVYTIINSTTQRFFVPLSIMAETAVEAEELHQTKRSQIDTSTRKISIIGTKQHDNGTYQLKPATTEALRLYLAKYTADQPFPTPRQMGETWRRERANRARDTSNPELLKIPMKNLRNYAGAVFYLTMGKDPIATKNFMRHKRLEQTMDYLRGMTEFTANTERIGKIVSTPEEVLDLILQGFKEESVIGQGTPNEKHILSKLKF